MKSGWEALSDKTRRDILKLLKNRPHTAGEISDQFLLSAATVSHHLSVLKESGLIEGNKRKQTIIYSLKTDVLHEIMQEIAEFFEPEPSRPEKGAHKHTRLESHKVFGA